MAITTIDAAVAGMRYPTEFAKLAGGTMVAGRDHSFWFIGGLPAAATVPGAGVGLYGQVLTGSSITGDLDWTNPVSGNTYLARFQGSATISGTLVLCDRLWQNHIAANIITGTTENIIQGPVIPARDANGTANGVGVYAAFEVSSTLGNGTPTLTLKYVNEQGVSGHTATNIMPCANGPTTGDFFRFGLAAGDLGIQRVISVTLSSTYTSGTASVVLYRPIARLELTSAFVPNAIDAFTSGFPKIYNDSNLFLLFVPSTTTTSNITGQVIYTQG